MRTWQAILIAIGLFIGGALSAVVVGLFLAESWIVFSVYMVAGLLSAIAFFGAYYFHRHTMKWVLAGLIVAVGFLGLLWHGGGKAIGALSNTNFVSNGYEIQEQPLGLNPEEVAAIESDYTVTIINAGNGSLTFSVGPLPLEMGVAIACQAGLSHETVQTHSYVEGTSLLDWDFLVEDSGHAPGEGWLNRDNGTWYCSYLDLRVEIAAQPQGDDGPPELPETLVPAEPIMVENAECVLLGDEPSFIGTFCMPRDADTPDVTIPVAEGGYTMVTLGTGCFNGECVSPVRADVFHLVLFYGRPADGGTPGDLNLSTVLTDYVSGSVGITHITALTSYEAALADALGAENVVTQEMTEANPSCGQEYCNQAYVWEWDWETGTLTLIESFQR